MEELYGECNLCPKKTIGNDGVNEGDTATVRTGLHSSGYDGDPTESEN